MLSLTVNDGKAVSEPPQNVYVRLLVQNDNPPTLTILQDTAEFNEGESTPQPLILASSTVTIDDTDCGAIVTKAEVSLPGRISSESLTLTGFTSPTATFDDTTGTLTIDGEANYEVILKGVEYLNTADEPGPDPRTVTYRVFDGTHWSALESLSVTFLFMNDNEPFLDLDSDLPGTGYSIKFNEGGGEVPIAASGRVQATDEDINTLIHSVSVLLLGTQDGSEEEIQTDQTDNSLDKPTATTFKFTFTNPKTLSQTEAFIETLRYANDAVNPTQGTRTAQVTINDGKFDSNEAEATIVVDATNDNPPTFPSPTPSGTVKENSGNGVSVVTVTAQDADGDALTYSIINGNTGGVFTIAANTGVITTTGATIDYENEVTYTLTVQANDGNFTASTSVSIAVTDENDNCPTFSDGTTHTKTIPSTTAVSSNVITLAISDADTSTVFQLAITSGNDDGLFGISENNVIVASSLSSSQFTSHTLNVALTDSTLPTCSQVATVTIVILSPNSVFDFTVDEEQNSGTPVGKIITDPDFPQTTYTITDPLSAPFAIDTSSQITTTAVLDRETKDEYTLTITFSIQSSPVTITVTVTVNDINDQTPQFSSSSYSESIQEGASGNINVGLSASDGDIGVNAEFTFTVSGTTVFGVQQTDNTGVITVVGNLDYESQCSYTFQVIATDDGDLTATANVEITITNVNEHAPMFQSFTPPVISETFMPNDVVMTITATDPDKCPTESSAAGSITYSIEGNAGSYQIEAATGIIQVNTAVSVGTTMITVRASDNDVTGGLTADREVTITVEEITSPVVDLNGAEVFLSPLCCILHYNIIVFCRPVLMSL